MSTNTTWGRWIVRLLKIGAIAAVGAAGIYFFRFSPVPVEAHQVEHGPIVADVMGTGTLEARVTVTISPKISGRIKEVLADQGDRVQAGDLLVRLDDENLTQQVMIAEAEVDTARAVILQLESGKVRADAIVHLAQITYDRNLKLMQKRVTSQDEVDRTAEAVAVAHAELSRAESGISVGKKQLASAERTLTYHKSRLKDASVRAPVDGLIVRRQREAGDIVVPGGAILTLISTDELWIRAWVDETEMSRLRAGQSARVLFRSEPATAYPGKVIRMSKEADRETREFIVDVRVLELPINWAVGQRAEVYIETEHKTDATLLPASFLRVRAGVTGVFVDEDQRAAWRPITLGLRSRDTVDVVGGVRAGETVVIAEDPKKSLTDGRRIALP